MCEIAKLTLKEDDTLIIRVDTDYIDLDQARMIYNDFKRLLPKSSVICIPKGVSLSVQNKQELIKYLKETI